MPIHMIYYQNLRKYARVSFNTVNLIKNSFIHLSYRYNICVRQLVRFFISTREVYLAWLIKEKKQRHWRFFVR